MVRAFILLGVGESLCFVGLEDHVSLDAMRAQFLGFTLLRVIGSENKNVVSMVPTG